MKIEKLAVNCLNLAGDHTYQILRENLLRHNRKWLVGRSDLYRFAKGKLEGNLKQAQKVVEIRKGLYDYEYFNICFLNNVLALLSCRILTSAMQRVKISGNSFLNSRTQRR